MSPTDMIAQVLIPALRVACLFLVCALGLGCRPALIETGSDQPQVRGHGGYPFVRVVGSVQDGGFPHAACNHPACRRARETGEERFVSGLAIVLPVTEKTLLVDATPDLREQLELLADVRRPPADRVDRSPVDGVFITHAHIGHYLGLAFFGFEAVHTRDLPVYCTASMADYLRHNGPWSQLVELSNIQLHEIALDVPLDLGEGVSIAALGSPHRDEYSDTVGFLIAGPRSSLLYLPDTDSWEAWGSSVIELVDKVDVALLDGSFYSLEELPGRDVASIGHPLISDSINRLGTVVAAGKTRVYFTHLNHSNPALDSGSAESAAIEAAGFAVVREGDEFEL